MPLLSVQFLGFAFAAILASLLTRGALRSAVFLAASLYFAATYVPPAGLASTLLFCLAGYVSARMVLAGWRRAAWAGPALITVAFVYMRGYGVIDALLPRPLAARALATAGLSFLFFKVLHVLIDARAGTLGELRLITYLNYCLNFTTFLMGPIQRYQDFAEQWANPEATLPPAFEGNLDAVNRILRGLVKKFVLGEILGRLATLNGADFATIPAATLLAKSYLFYLFLYCDFSGYCDVMIGIGILMGVRPPENFWLPFFSRNIAQYWLRVHRSLTLWLTDYVFNPSYAWALRNRLLGASAIASMSAALMTTMVIAGLWHGTTVNFLVFGLLHGVYLVGFRLYERGLHSALGVKRAREWSATPLATAVAMFMTFNLTSAAYLCFELNSAQMWQLARRLV